MQPANSDSKPVHFIASAEALERCADSLRRHAALAFDLEFDSHRHAYGVTLCLIQVATPEASYVVDPFAIADLKPLYEVFEDPAIQKIVHSPGEDLRLLHAQGCYPQNLFDTAVTAALLNYEQTSLAAMLQEKLGHSISKQQQRSNWLRRPLSEEQIAYAADDVAWLHALKAVLEAEAAERGLLAYVGEEQAALSTTIYKQEERETFLKPADFHGLSPYEQFVLDGLFRHRDEQARRLNKPSFQVMDEQVVRDLASGALLPIDLPDAKGVHGSMRNARAIEKLEDLLDALSAESERRGLSKAPPPRRRLTPEEQAARATADRDKNAKFMPIQQALATRFGTFAARIILSGGAVGDLLKKTTTLGTMRPYRAAIVREEAAKLGIDLSDYE